MDESIRNLRFNELKEFLETVPNSTVGIYGIGNHTNMLLDFMGSTLKSKIVCLIDEQSKNRNRFGFPIKKINDVKGIIKYVIISSDIYQYIIYNNIKLYEKDFKIIKIYREEDYNFFGKNLSYSEIREVWNKDETKVHSCDDEWYFEEFSKHVLTIMDLSQNDKVLDIGCGDGNLDYYIKKYCKKLFGFDFALSKLNKAIDKNPDCIYWEQSLLDRFIEQGFDKIFSFGVVQYCNPKDFNLMISNCLEALQPNGRLYLFQIPVKSKMIYYYKKTYPYITEDVINEYIIDIDRFMNDGSYIYEDKFIKNIFNDMGLSYTVIDDKTSEGDYRNHYIIWKN